MATSKKPTKPAPNPGRKQRPATVPLSISLRSPAPQTSPIFKLPTELILSILSHIAPDPELAGHWARFRLQCGLGIDDSHHQRIQFLLPLSMTCRAMRLRLIPWIWERLESPAPSNRSPTLDVKIRKLNAITNAVRADTFLATSVRFLTVGLGGSAYIFFPFVKCLQSLPNLHTLEIGRTDDFPGAPLKSALKGVELPQIKTLIISLPSYPLLQHCREVEDVVCLVVFPSISPERFLRSLASNRDSKVKRLAIPLAICANPSLFVAACPRLTELSVVLPHQPDIHSTETGTTLSAMSGLAAACRALPDFDTLQIIRFPGHIRQGPSKEQWKQTFEMLAKDLEQCAVDVLKKPGTGCREGEWRRTTLRVIKFGPGRPCKRSVKVEEYEV